jgi:hypothetical protein
VGQFCSFLICEHLKLYFRCLHRQISMISRWAALGKALSLRRAQGRSIFVFARYDVVCTVYLNLRLSGIRGIADWAECCDDFDGLTRLTGIRGRIRTILPVGGRYTGMLRIGISHAKTSAPRRTKTARSGVVVGILKHVFFDVYPSPARVRRALSALTWRQYLPLLPCEALPAMSAGHRRSGEDTPRLAPYAFSVGPRKSSAVPAGSPHSRASLLLMRPTTGVNVS